MYNSLITATLTALASSAMAKRVNTGECAMLMGGHGPTAIGNDTSAAFLALKDIGDSATSAVTPSGYIQSYSNTQSTYNEPSLFAGYVELQEYDVDKCAEYCDLAGSCNAFTIFYERTPLMLPGPQCRNPPSSTKIKCSLWSGTITPDVAMNKGQFQEEFEVLIAGSNAYVKDVIDQVPIPNVVGYATEVYDHGAAIQAPLDCHGKDTYLGVMQWYDGKYSASRCLDRCDDTPECNFVNTFFQRKNNVPYSQHCSMFSARWPESFATNQGQYRNNVVYHMNTTYSYGFTRADGLNHDACVPT